MQRSSHSIALTVAAALASINLCTCVMAQADATSAQSADAADESAWLEKLPPDDRAALEPHIGQTPPPFSSDLIITGANAKSWEDLRGKVVIVQSWTSAQEAGRKVPERFAAACEGLDLNEVRLIALHTPDNANNAEVYLKRKPLPASLISVVDPKGAFCDALGVYKQPVNLVIDRSGFVRYVGLNDAGVRHAATKLIAEPFDPNAVAAKAKEKAKRELAAFPTFTGSVSAVHDYRGRKAPDFHVDQFLTAAPELTDKVVIIDFWATWCGPCIATIPHMNELAEKFGDKIACIGISNEKRSDFDEGLRRRKLSAASFKYALALDPSDKMSSAIGVRGIPHCIVMSKDWVVRWQGHPGRLSAADLKKIVDANDTLPSKPKTSGKQKRGWRS